MPDSLNLSLWFPDFNGPAMLPHALAVLQQFPFSEIRPGITYVAVQPVSWSEPSILERRFSPGITPEEAMVIAADLIHDDFAFVFEAYWDLWSPDDQAQWKLIPCQVKFIVQGEEFEDGTSQETGHIQIDFGLDSPFLVGVGRKSRAEVDRATAKSAVTILIFHPYVNCSSSPQTHAGFSNAPPSSQPPASAGILMANVSFESSGGECQRLSRRSFVG
jgi:hypothetical protein